mgnify:CR=1 FL=1
MINFRVKWTRPKRATCRGLTASFKKIEILNDNDSFLTGGTGEIYVVTSSLDGTGEMSEFKTQIFEGINDGDGLPLGDGGMLVCFLRDAVFEVDHANNRVLLAHAWIVLSLSADARSGVLWEKMDERIARMAEKWREQYRPKEQA